MSAPRETNNQNRVPPPENLLNNASGQSYTRDPEYYYDDGNIVLLVGGVLFKLHKFTLISHMDERPDESAQFTRSDIQQSIKGMSDNDPFVIWKATPQQFRHFLFFILGTPANPEYISRFMEANNPRNHTKDAFVCYLGMAVLAQYFGMSELESWSYIQLARVLKSTARFVNSHWDKYTVMQIMGCAGREKDGLAYEMRDLVRLALSISALNNLFDYPPPLSSNLDTCVALYKDLSLPGTYPKLFGYVFTIILSLGHHSPVWTSQLTREDRTILYAAQAHLVSLHRDPGLQLSWLLRPPSQIWDCVCASCADRIDTTWRDSFASCGGLNSTVPLEDVSKLVLLPSYRRLFFDSTRSDTESCGRNCGHGVRFAIDRGIDHVFSGMYRKYKHFVENA